MVRKHWQTLKRSMKNPPKEGFQRKLRLRTPEDAETAEIRREPLACDRRSDTRPVDIIGDIDGCREELKDPFDKLGHQIRAEPTGTAGPATA